jgi:hypothetical protein
MKAFKTLIFGWIILTASFSLYGQLQPSEASAIEAAWASGQRLANISVPLRRGFDAKAPFENISTDATGIARASTKQWERIEVHLPPAVAADLTVCLMVNSKCQALPVGASFDKRNSTFYWHVPAPYKGDFDFVFLQPGSRVGSVRITAGSEVITNLRGWGK